MPPLVSIIIPCYNEQGRIRALLEAIRAQTFPPRSLEVVLADGLSTDGTRQVITEFAQAQDNLSIHVVDNPRRIIPAALNCALREAQGEIILRLDAHCLPYPDYVERCVADLQAGLGENVGGSWDIQPGAKTWMAASIAAAAAHPLGAGDALYRHASRAAAVDTVPFGCFKRDLLAVVGFFDESLLTNEDYEFNVRIRKAGGRVWLDPAIRSVYFARASLSELIRQYARYGYWKARMLRRYPGTLRARQALPPLFVASLILAAALALFLPFFRLVLAGEILVYALILLGAGALSAWVQRRASLLVGFALAIAAMHVSWGTGFLWSMIKGIIIPEVSQRK
jgi:glycosyltransferase involved in cell wall biosynthesis